MDIPKAIVLGDYSDFLQGREVDARVPGPVTTDLLPGAHIMAFKNTIAATSTIAVPKTEQSHYIGIEGTVTQVHPGSRDGIKTSEVHVKIKKL
jgi:hypothetical protein